MIRENSVKKRLASGGTVVGTYVKIADPSIVEILGLAGFDFFVLDNEHGFLNPETMANLFRAADSTGIVPLVRTSGQDPVELLKVLDAGALGVVVPHVDTREQARSVVRSVKYIPRGERGIGTVTRAARYGSMPLPAYLATANENTLVVCYCESVEAVRNIDEILTVEDLDVVFIGPMDLSQSLGIISHAFGTVNLGDGTKASPAADAKKDPRFLEAINTVASKTIAAGKTVGIIASSPAEARSWVEKGFRYVAISCDQAMLASLCKKFVEDFRA